MLYQVSLKELLIRYLQVHMRGSLDDKMNNKRKSLGCPKLVWEMWLLIRRKTCLWPWLLVPPKLMTGRSYIIETPQRVSKNLVTALPQRGTESWLKENKDGMGILMSCTDRLLHDIYIKLVFYIQIFQRLLSSGQLGLRSYLNLPAREKWRSWVSRQSRRMSSIK